jgi:CHASE2 domain-containing sensor protein
MPMWFRVVAVVLILWNLMGAYACIQQFRLGADAMGDATAYDRRLYASLPAWYNWVFALAEISGVAGTVALLLGRRIATPLLIASLVFVAVQFGYLFATSDIIAAKGVWTTYFPAFIALICILQIWLARLGERRGWLV